MKKYTNTLLALLLAGTFIGCGSNNDTKIKEDANTSTPDVPKEETTPPAQEQTQKMPTCYIKEGTPKTDSSIVVHAKCKDGNIPIDEAKVTLDNTVKSVDYKGVYFSDYIGFDNLQPSTTYKAILEVVVGGKTIKESVKIKTREEEVVVTPTVSAPQWRKNLYDIYRDNQKLMLNKNRIILDLNKETSSNKKDNINYSILKSNYTITEYSSCLQDAPFNEKSFIQVKSDTLYIHTIPPCIGEGTLQVEAKSAGGSSVMTVKITFDDSLWMPVPPQPYWTKELYDNITINSLIINPEAEILNLNRVCSGIKSEPIRYTIIKTKLIIENGLIDPNFSIEKSLFIKDGVLKINASSVYSTGVIVTVRARNKYGFNDTKIKFELETLAFPIYDNHVTGK